VAEGLGFSQIREGVSEIFPALDMFVPVSPNGMTDGAQVSVAAGETGEKRFGEGGKWAVGRKLAWAGVLPRGLFNFFFLFFSVFAMKFCLNPAKTSD
jgi:hypothetical protein